MMRRIISRASTVIAITGVLFSVASLFLFLSKSLRLPELSWSIVSTVLGVLIGMYSTYFTGWAKRIAISPRVFISYSISDQEIAGEVATLLREQGARVWLDQERLTPGQPILESIERGIESANKLVVLISRQQASNLPLELRIAQSKGVPVIPVLLADTDVPSELQGIRYIDLRKDRTDGLKELARAAT